MDGRSCKRKKIHSKLCLRLIVLLCLGMCCTIWQIVKPTHDPVRTSPESGVDITSKIDLVMTPPKPIALQRIKSQRSTLKPVTPKFSQTVANTKRYLVYDCSNRWPGFCGGWSDRISGILSTYVLALLTNRTFLINFDNPCQLENYFNPKSYDWRYNKSILRYKTSRNYLLTNNNGRELMDLLTTANSTQQLKDFFTAEVSFVRINWDMTPEFRQFRHVENIVPWITKMHYADINRHIFDLFLQPKPFLSKTINSVLNNKRTKTSFCAHVRIGRSSTIPGDNVRTKLENVHVILDFIESIDKNKNDLFLATDNDKLQRQFMANYSKNFILKVPGRITHIDLTKSGDVCDGFQKQVLDFMLLTRCDKLVICESGFSMMAAYWRKNSDGLYCWTQKAVVPCSRYTVNDFFPKPLIGPPR